MWGRVSDPPLPHHFVILSETRPREAKKRESKDPYRKTEPSGKESNYPALLKYCTCFSCFCAAAFELNVPRFFLFPLASFFLEYKRNFPELNLRIIAFPPPLRPPPRSHGCLPRATVARPTKKAMPAGMAFQPRTRTQSKISTADAITVVHSPRLSPTADCVTFAVRTILFEIR